MERRASGPAFAVQEGRGSGGPGRRASGIQLSRRVFSPEKCARPPLPHGHIEEAKLLYSVHEKLRYTCAPGYTTPAGLAQGEVQCLPDGWSSPPACSEEQGTCTPVLPKTQQHCSWPGSPFLFFSFLLFLKTSVFIV